MNKKIIMPELFKFEEFKYHGRIVDFMVDNVTLQDGTNANREYVKHPGAVGVIPIFDNGDVLLVRQYRYAVKCETWEIPAGKLNGPVDSPEARAHAELEEETGYSTKHLNKILSFFPSPGFSSEVIHLFAAHRMKKGKAHPDVGEFVKIKRFKTPELFQMISEGKILDAKTIIAIHRTRCECDD